MPVSPIRLLPRKSRQAALCCPAAIAAYETGFATKVTEVYVPLKNTSNPGYAFVTFVSREAVQEGILAFDGKVFGHSNTKKICRIVPAYEQDALQPSCKHNLQFRRSDWASRRQMKVVRL